MRNVSKDAINFKNMSVDEAREYFKLIDEPTYRANQLLEWMYSERVFAYEQMTSLPAYLRERLYNEAPLYKPKVIKVSKSEDTTKSLIELLDEETCETVAMYHDYGISQCVSSQVGCAMKCAFCASGMSGFTRNLSCAEMIDQMITTDERVSSVVIMGMGEPLLNYDNVLRFVRLLNWNKGFNIGLRHVTISTCGIVPKIKDLAKENLPITLSLSLHASNNQTRSQLMPINEQYPIEEVISACKEYAEYTGRRVTYEYIMLKGINDSLSDADRLSDIIRGSLAHVNLIPYNPVEELPFERSLESVVEAFQKRLELRGIEVTQRREKGVGIDAACGQLRRRVKGRI